MPRTCTSSHLPSPKHKPVCFCLWGTALHPCWLGSVLYTMSRTGKLSRELNGASEEQKPKCSYGNYGTRLINLFLRAGGSGMPRECGKWSNYTTHRPKPLGDAPVHELIPALQVHTKSLPPPREFPRNSAHFWGRASVSANDTPEQKKPKQQHRTEPFLNSSIQYPR